MKINILSPVFFPYFNYGIFFPLLKWRDDFNNQGISFRFFHSHLDKKINRADMLIIDWRYIDLIQKGWYKLPGIKPVAHDFLNEWIVKIKSKGLKTVLFDSSDAAGTRAFDIIPFIDLVLKKQIFKDINQYANADVTHHYMCWLPSEIPERDIYRGRVIEKQDLSKMKLGWNIGMTDYRVFPNIINKLPFSTTNIFPGLYKKLPITSPFGVRDLLFSFRGSLKKNARYDYSRKLLLETLESNRNEISGKFHLGGKIKKNRYLAELKASKVGISPFGWGEICFRDFEIMLNGSLLVKPSVAHLQTWPPLFEEGKTYMPVKWDYSDLLKVLNSVDDRWSDYAEIASHAQSQFIEYYHSAEIFINHFKKQLYF